MVDYKKLNVPKSERKIQIAVLGSSEAITTKIAYKLAFETGIEIAKKGAKTLTGGGLGVMEAALKGAKYAGGETIAIVPWEDINHVNEYADTVIATGIGWSRNSINLNSCDGAIIVGGGAGTLNEATYGYMMRKPLVALTPSGGMAKELTNSYFDTRKSVFIDGEDTPEKAVERVLKLIKKQTQQKTKQPTQFSDLDKSLLNTEERHNWHIKITSKKTKKQNKTKK